jgi:hypothetical protein
MIYEINIVLMVIAFLMWLPLLNKKEGFNEFNFDEENYIPYVSQDVICLILVGAGVSDINKYGIIMENCTRGDKKLNPDTSNYCPA